MRIPSIIAIVLTLSAAGFGTAALAQSMCATPEQAKRIQAFYKDKPATMPVIAARQLDLPEALVASGLATDQMAGTTGAAFTDVWAAMMQWKQAVFLITKDQNIFEILSPVAAATPSKTSQYTNVAYDHPLRGHLRPDLYTSIYVVALPGKDGVVARGVLFYDANGASVFGAFVSGEGPAPTTSDLANFDALMALVKSRPPVCSAN